MFLSIPHIARHCHRMNSLSVVVVYTPRLHQPHHHHQPHSLRQPHHRQPHRHQLHPVPGSALAVQIRCLHPAHHHQVFRPRCHQGIAQLYVHFCRIHSDITRLELTTVFGQGRKIGASLGGAIILILILLIIIYFKRKQRFRRLALQTQILSASNASTGSGPVSEAREMSQSQTSGTLTPFTLPLSLNVLVRLQGPLTKSAPTAFLGFPPSQPHTQNELNSSSQPPTYGSLRTDSDRRDTTTDVLQQLEGHPLGERDPDGRTSTNRNIEDPLGIWGDGTSDAPPTYTE
jgi:hypothetical protein